MKKTVYLRFSYIWLVCYNQALVKSLASLSSPRQLLGTGHPPGPPPPPSVAAAALSSTTLSTPLSTDINSVTGTPDLLMHNFTAAYNNTSPSSSSSSNTAAPPPTEKYVFMYPHILNSYHIRPCVPAKIMTAGGPGTV